MKERTLYLECTAGISGDMTVAALLDLGADRDILQKALDSIPAEGFTTEITRISKAGLDCCNFSVCLDAEHENHDHDMEYLYGHEHAHDHEHEGHHHHDHDHEGHHHDHDHEDHHHDHDHEDHHHDHDHDHEDHHHDHEHHHHGHHHVHRHMSDIREILAAVDMTPEAHALALEIFGILARAEAKAHGTSTEEVHFHEVGAVDSIADIVAAAVCYDDLKRRENITRVVVPYLAEGQGTVRCAHGILPVPVPAVTHITEEAGLTLRIMNAQGEFVTPTGAAIAAALMTDRELPEDFRILGTGMGAGKREYARPNILRAMLLENAAAPAGTDTVLQLDTNIDDCSGETLGFVMEQLLEAGALDVWYTPIYMKKGRPAWKLSVLCRDHSGPGGREVMEQILFTQTTTIGIRRSVKERTVLPREAGEVRTPHGTVKVKLCRLPDGSQRVYPEYESVRQTALAAGVPFTQAYAEAAGGPLNG